MSRMYVGLVIARLRRTSQRSSRPAAICAGVTISRPDPFTVEMCSIGRVRDAAARANGHAGSLPKLVKNWKTDGRRPVCCSKALTVSPPVTPA